MTNGPLTTLTNVKKGASSASATVTKNGDGSIEFIDLLGNKIVAHSNEPLQKFFEVINDLS